MIDSHCHLDFQHFCEDREQVLSRCKDLGIHHILVPGTQASAWSAQITLCDKHPQLLPALGLHPYFLASYSVEQLDTLSQLLQQHKTKLLAVGEIGLDYAIDVAPELQQQVFVAQLQLAQQFNLPVIIHHRQSHNDLIRLLKAHTVPRGGVIHAFSGSRQVAESYIELGFMLGVGGTITYPRAVKTRNTVAELPLTSLLLETDAPDMPMHGRQGQRNSPEYLPEVAAALAQLKGISVDEVVGVTTDNFNRLFFADAEV